jgi:hypothetical protein
MRNRLNNVKLSNVLLQDFYGVTAHYINWRNYCEVSYSKEHVISRARQICRDRQLISPYYHTHLRL